MTVGSTVPQPASSTTSALSTAEFSAVASSRAELLLRVTASLADAVSAEDVYTALVDKVAEVLDASSAALWLVDDANQTGRLVRSRGYRQEVADRLLTVPLDAAGSMPVVDSILRGVPIWMPSQAALLTAYPHLRGLTTNGRHYRAAALPLLSQDRVLGALGLTIEREGEVTPEERGFLVLVSRYAGQALERLRLLEGARAAAAEHRRLYQESHAAHVRAEQLYAFAQAVSAARSLDEVFEAALSAIEIALGTGRLAILLMDDEGAMRFRAWRALSDDYRQAVDGHSPWARDAGQFDPVLVEDAARDRSLSVYADLFAREEIGALAFFPLATGGQLLGKFMVYYGTPHVFADHDVETAGAIANHLASVITRFTAIRRLEETVRANELFAAVLAHDLRNPLGAIMTAAQVLLLRSEGQGSGTVEKDRQPLARILRSGQRMTAMIDQLLDVARVRSGSGIPVDPHPANLDELCSQAIAELELAHPEWTIRYEPKGDLAGHWDGNRLLQVISNIVGNAGTHGTPGTGIQVVADGTQKTRVRLKVRNEGTIAESIRPHLFDPFAAARRQHASEGGLGLGLFIVNAVVRAHGGAVDVSSTAAQTTVTITLPRTSAQASPARTETRLQP